MEAGRRALVADAEKEAAAGMEVRRRILEEAKNEATAGVEVRRRILEEASQRSRDLAEAVAAQGGMRNDRLLLSDAHCAMTHGSSPSRLLPTEGKKEFYRLAIEMGASTGSAADALRASC
jgi:hypothetical protein